MSIQNRKEQSSEEKTTNLISDIRKILFPCFVFSCGLLLVFMLKNFFLCFCFFVCLFVRRQTFKKQKTVYHYFCSIINGILIVYVLTIINGILIVYVLIQKCTPIYIHVYIYDIQKTVGRSVWKLPIFPKSFI
jgi:hypothetical protein